MMDMNKSVIIGPANKINWLMVAAFRYCVGRHTTQAMYGIDEIILNNLDVLNTVFIKQFIREIEHEQYVTELDQGRNKRYEIDFVEVDELSETERGTGGFGSTGTR